MPKRVASLRPVPADTRPKNKLLSCLPRSDFARLRPHLRTVPLTVKQVLHPRNEPIREVFFPNGGVASVTAVMRNGAMVEIATIGDEGLVGINAFFGSALMSGEAMMQVPDTNAEVMSVQAFRAELDRRGAFYDSVQLYSQGLVILMMQSAACNALHPVQERCARWLLMTHDRMHLQDFHLSHEFLAVMLGVQRPTVSVVAGALQAKGLISYTHGHVRVLDRTGLEAASCMCYAVIRGYFEAGNVRPRV